MASTNNNARPAKRPRSEQDGTTSASVETGKEGPVAKFTFSRFDVPEIDPNTNDPEDFFGALIHPVPKSDFMEKYFRRRAVHVVTNGGDDRIHPILNSMEGLDPSHILRETSSENIFVWLTNKEKKIESIEVDSADTALSLHHAGHATYCRASPQVEQPLVRHTLAATGMGCGEYDPTNERSMTLGRGEVEVFMSTRSHTTDWHYDFQENFTLQLSGSKRWSLQKGVVQYPLRGCTPHYAAPEAVESQMKAAHLSNPTFQFGNPKVGVNSEGSVEEVVLRPGDFLYHPAGIWHRVETLEPGVSINISLMATNYASITCQALQHFLLRKAIWRETLASGGYARSVPERLNHLLETQLLDDVKEFISQCGAGAIVPPVLSGIVDVSCLAEASEDGGVDDDENGISQDPIEAVENGVEETEDENEPIIDVNLFSGPDISYPLQFCINPLASLMRMNEDILGYYRADDKMEDVYVLNVNYAGNDTHESAVRVLLRDRAGHLERYRDPNCVPGQPVYSSKIAHDLPPWQKCLAFYGFLLPNHCESGSKAN
jgi:hypothetical protein